MDNIAELDQIMDQVDEDDAPAEQTEFTITDDAMADWALRKIKRAREAHDAYAAQCTARIEQLQEAINQINARLNISANSAARTEEFFRSKLEGYFRGLPDDRIKTTKTLRKYKLPEGELVLKSLPPQMSCADDDQLLMWLRENEMCDKIKTVEKPMWADVKAELTASSAGAIHKETGEIVPGVSVVLRSPVFEVKL